LHAGLQQRQRLKHLDKFTENDAGVLVATDVAARGLDIPDVRAVRCPPIPSRPSASASLPLFLTSPPQVVHYDVPPSVDAYVHRSGRTARAAADGVSLCLIGC
jgi:ATP-dependent RNA helicase DDX24/MAK5